MRKLNLFLLGLMTVGLIACDGNNDDDDNDDNDDNGNNQTSNTKKVSSNITSDKTWSSDKTYILADRVSVTDGATLTIEPGTIIKGQAGTGANATALVIAKDGKINANGKADKPIIFTTVADEIEQGQVKSPNMSPGQNGFWGGVVVLGDAPISARSETIQFEGIPASDKTGQYGGSNPGHNAGTIKYISIRHGGANIGEGNEINGLTLGGVGNQTTVENIEIVANQDDGLECFGGTVDVKNVLVWKQADDAYDMDQAYKGTVDNFIAIKGPESDHGLELDGPEGSSKGIYTLQNASIKGYNDGGKGGGEYADFRDDAAAVLKNIYFFNHSQSADLEFDTDAIADNYLNGSGNERIEFNNLKFNVSHLSDGNTTIDEIFVDKGDDNNDCFSQKKPDAKVVSSDQHGANAGALNWTWASKAGELSDF